MPESAAVTPVLLVWSVDRIGDLLGLSQHRAGVLVVSVVNINAVDSQAVSVASGPSLRLCQIPDIVGGGGGQAGNVGCIDRVCGLGVRRYLQGWPLADPAVEATIVVAVPVPTMKIVPLPDNAVTVVSLVDVPCAT